MMRLHNALGIGLLLAGIVLAGASLLLMPPWLALFTLAVSCLGLGRYLVRVRSVPAQRSEPTPWAGPQVTPQQEPPRVTEAFAHAPPPPPVTPGMLPDVPATPTDVPSMQADVPEAAPETTPPVPPAAPPPPAPLVFNVTTYQEGQVTGQRQIPVRLFIR